MHGLFVFIYLLTHLFCSSSCRSSRDSVAKVVDCTWVIQVVDYLGDPGGGLYLGDPGSGLPG